MPLSAAVQLAGAGNAPFVLGLSLLGGVCWLLLFLFAVALPGQRDPDVGASWGSSGVQL